MTKYIIRLDDLSGFSSIDKWGDILLKCEENGLRALIGLIPKCTDKKLDHGTVMDHWGFARGHLDHDYAIHGFNHETFGDKKYDQQYRLMAASMKEFVSHKIIPEIFIPPKHSYNSDTLMAIHDMGIQFMSDGVGLYPWRDFNTDVVCVPQILWRPRRVLFGTITFCLHPDTMGAEELKRLLIFIDENKKDIISIQDVSLSPLEVINVPFKPIYKYIYKKRFST
jgi:hypothetical protein